MEYYDGYVKNMFDGIIEWDWRVINCRWLMMNVRCWKVEVYEELARIFSEDNNQSAQRELLMKEGTAKFAETVGENDRQLQKVLQKQSSYANVLPTISYFFILNSCYLYIIKDGSCSWLSFPTKLQWQCLFLSNVPFQSLEFFSYSH